MTLMKSSKKWLSGATVALLTGYTGVAADELKQLITDGDIDLNLRYRFAFIDRENFAENARASTLLTMLGVRTGKVNGFSAYFQVRNVLAVGAERYNSTINGLTQFPVEPDPEATEIDQAYAQYDGIEGTKITVGRRKLSWGNQRFVSFLVWRQNQVSYDGATIESQLSEDLDVKYSYAFNVNRPFTDDSPVGNFEGDFHLLNVNYDFGDLGKSTAYAYLLDFDSPFAQALSTNTFGGLLEGRQKLGGGASFGYHLEFAHQVDVSNNPFDISNQYLRIEPSIRYDGLNVRAGYELLGGNGQRGFQTPFALLHAFNGLADQFLVTPAGGLQDVYGEIKYTVKDDGIFKGLTALVQYHDFRAHQGGRRYGTEWDAVATKKIGPVNVMAKLAVFNDIDFNGNDTRFWLQFASKF